MDERALTERLITYDTSTLEGMQSAAGFVKGWLEARDVEVTGTMHNGRPVLAATVGPAGGPVVVFHGHLDVVPARPEQFSPAVHGDRLYGRGAYDMKGGLAGMMLAVHDLIGQERVRVHFVCVADEESEEVDQRGSDYLVEQGYIGNFAITGEPTNMHIGIQAKGVLAMRIEVIGTAAHGSTPWVGDNAVLKAIDVFRQIETLPFARESSDLFDRPSINLGRIVGGDALNKVPDLCAIDVDVRYLPGQDADEIRAAIDAPRWSSATTRTCRPSGRRSVVLHRRAASSSPWGATAPPTRSRSSRPGSRPWSAGPSAAAIMVRRSGFRSGRSAIIGGRWSSSSTCSRLVSARTSAPSGSPDARGHPTPRSLEAPAAGRRARRVRGRGSHGGRRVSRGRQGGRRARAGP